MYLLSVNTEATNKSNLTYIREFDREKVQEKQEAEELWSEVERL